jgi:hypothetical protein
MSLSSTEWTTMAIGIINILMMITAIITMEQNPSWEDDSRIASQDTVRTIWNPKAHYHVHKSSPVLNLPSYAIEIYLNRIIPSVSRSSKRSLLFTRCNQNSALISHLTRACYVTCPSHTPLFAHPNNIRWTARTMGLLIRFFPPFCYFIPRRCKYSPRYRLHKHPQSVFFY